MYGIFFIIHSNLYCTELKIVKKYEKLPIFLKIVLEVHKLCHVWQCLLRYICTSGHYLFKA